MLRDIRSAFGKPRLSFCKYTTAGSSVTMTGAGVGQMKMSSSGTGICLGTFSRAYARAPIVVANPMSTDVASGGTAMGTILPTSKTFRVTTAANNGGAADDGSAHAIILGYDSADSLRIRPTGNGLTCLVGNTRIETFLIDGANGTITTNSKGATIVKGGTGDYTLTFTKAFANSNVVAVGTCVATRVCSIASTSATSVNVKIWLTSSGAATDATVHLWVVGTMANNVAANTSTPVVNSQRKPRIFGGTVTYASGVPAWVTGSGDSTLADTATGSATFTYKTPFARAPIVIASPVGPAATTTIVMCRINSCTTTALNIQTVNAAASLTDPPDGYGFCFLGLGWDDVSEY